MNKLNLDTLRIESFFPADVIVAADGDTSFGTNFCNSYCGPSCPNTCNATCPDTCWASCQNSLCITDCQGGGGTGTSVETCNRCVETERAVPYEDLEMW